MKARNFLALVLITGCLTSNFVAVAQSAAARQDDAATLAEDLIGIPEDDDNAEAAHEGMLQSLSSAVNLNRSDLTTLVSLNVISQEQARSIVDYRTAHGPFLSYYELQAVNLPLEVIERLRPFITVSDPGSAIDRTLLKRIRHESNNYLIMRVSRAWKADADTESYPGPPEHMLLRFRSSRQGDFSFGFNTEKDAGEPIRWDPRHKYVGFDRWTFHGQIQNKGIIRNLILGDYQAQYGQGLVMGGAFGAGKGAETITTIRRANVGLLPYTSAYESGNLRGVATTLRVSRHLDASLMYSSTRRDATAVEYGDKGKIVTALQRSGLHRTEVEMAGRQQLKDTQWAVVIQHKRRTLELGALFLSASYDAPMEPRATPYNQFAFRGKVLSNAGIYYQLTAGKVAAFGEAAMTLSGRWGIVAGMLCAVTTKMDIALLVRRYEPGFHVRFSNAISENSVPTNEHGTYLGWKYHFSRRVSATGYLDLFTFPWLRFRAYAPSSGYEWLFRLTYQPVRNILLYAQGRRESKMRNAPSRITYDQVAGIKDNYTCHVEVGLRDRLRLRTKLQASRFAEGDIITHGMALSQDVRLELRRLEIVGRFALFDTDNYDNRLYSYENDVLLAYSMPAYNGTGIRKMIMARIDVSRHLTLWARYAETATAAPEELSPGTTTPRHTIDREVRFQLRIQF